MLLYKKIKTTFKSTIYLKGVDEVRISCYVRVCRDDLHCENQKLILDNWMRNNISENYIYFEETETTRKSRPIKEGLMKSFREGNISTIVVTRVDRFARSLQELIMDIEYIINNNGRFVSILNGFDFQKKTYNASQQLMLNIFGAFAQFEREIIRERTLEGLARAKLQGRKGGRHKLGCSCGKCKQSKGIKPDWLSEKRVIKNEGGLVISKNSSN